MVSHLSLAEIPVVTPLAASIEVVKLVPMDELLLSVIKVKPRSTHLFFVSVRQIKPLPFLAIKFM